MVFNSKGFLQVPDAFGDGLSPPRAPALEVGLAAMPGADSESQWSAIAERRRGVAAIQTGAVTAATPNRSGGARATAFTD
ncbi:hypothetical protein [Mycobacterium sp. pR1184]|uniref:hypothetical protein n=1 Tax=Mycobacterium sp. pR1184 TaxID=3238981 RepID=UPI00351B4EB1